VLQVRRQRRARVWIDVKWNEVSSDDPPDGPGRMLRSWLWHDLWSIPIGGRYSNATALH
jgi:hypothetical protein